MPYVRYATEGRVLTITLDRPERKNPLTFESYAELRDFFRRLEVNNDVKAVVLTGEGGNFCSGGDVRDIIGPLTQRSPDELLEFTQMTGDHAAKHGSVFVRSRGISGMRYGRMRDAAAHHRTRPSGGASLYGAVDERARSIGVGLL
jgi:enoyl-CoA hydratase/carnithine racemase